jgi:CheY-like chemotaxis protein
MLEWSIIIAVVLALALAYAYYLRTSRKKVAKLRAAEYAERRARKHARRDARRQSRDKQIQEAAAARHRGDRRPIVLVADDSSTVLETIRKALEDRQYRVVLANHGREAWSAMQDFRPDIVVSDIDMPFLDGFGLLRMIRSDLDLADMPVILMTANASSMLEANKLAGVSGVLAKPFEDRDLVDQIRFLLQEE